MGLIGVSAALNFRVGYRAADTELDGLIYGTGAGLADVLKAMCPFVVAWGLKKSDWLAVGGAAVVFVVISLYSLTAGMGFASQHRAFREAERTGAIEERGDLRRELARLEAAADSLGPQRSEATIGREIEVVFARPMAKHSTVESMSSRCTLVRTATREACAEIAGLMSEVEKAREWAELQDKLAQVRGKIEQLGTAGASGSADPQIDTLKGILGFAKREVTREDIRIGLVALVAVMFELGSGLGLYLVTTPWRSDWTASREGAAAEMPARDTGYGRGVSAEVLEKGVMAKAAALGDVEEFVLARVDVASGGVSAAEMFAAYEAWCREGELVPLGHVIFLERFAQLARDVGIDMHQLGADVVYLGIGISRTLDEAALPLPV